MHALKKTFAGLAFATTLLVANDVRGQTLANTKTEVKAEAKKTLTAPVIKPGDMLDARRASYGENIAFAVINSPGFEISDERLAKGYANGFANREVTHGKPMYVTGTYETDARLKEPVIVCFIDGLMRMENGQEKLYTLVEFADEIPKIMDDYVKEFGTSKLIPENVQPTLVATLNP